MWPTAGSTLGSMPVAQWHYPIGEARRLFEQVPGQADYTSRGDRPDPRLVLYAARHLMPLFDRPAFKYRLGHILDAAARR